MCAEPRPSAASIDAFHEFGSVRHILNKPVYKLSGDQFVRISAAERADYVTVKLGMLEACNVALSSLWMPLGR